MSSLLRDLTDMGIAVNPDVNTGESSSSLAQAKSKVVSIFESHWDKENRTVILCLSFVMSIIVSLCNTCFEWCSTRSEHHSRHVITYSFYHPPNTHLLFRDKCVFFTLDYTRSGSSSVCSSITVCINVYSFKP